MPQALCTSIITRLGLRGQVPKQRAHGLRQAYVARKLGKKTRSHTTRPHPASSAHLPTTRRPIAAHLHFSIGRGGRVRRRKTARPRTTSFAPRMGRPNRVLTAPLPLFDVVAGRQSPNLTSAHLACCGVYPGLGGRVRRWKAGSRHDGWGALGFHVCLARVQDCREVCPSAV